jgi:hypothetical protein
MGMRVHIGNGVDDGSGVGVTVNVTIGEVGVKERGAITGTARVFCPQPHKITTQKIAMRNLFFITENSNPQIKEIAKHFKEFTTNTVPRQIVLRESL